MPKQSIKHTEFTQSLIDSKGISNKVKKKLLQFIETAQTINIIKLFELHKDVTADLTTQSGASMTDEDDRLNGILLIILEDEIRLRGISTPSDNKGLAN